MKITKCGLLMLFHEIISQIIRIEKERILACNGRIDTFREADGSQIGPYRVWLKNENIPGLAMSRSI